MAKLSITTAWNEASAFVKQEAGPLFLIAFGLITLPNIVFEVLLPGARMLPLAGGQGGIESGAANLWSAVALVPMILLSLWATLTITFLTLAIERVVGTAFRRASARILPLFGATLVVGIIGVIVAMPFVLLMVGRGELVPGRIAGYGIILMLILVAGLARLVLMTPVAAAERTGPIGMITRSIALTRGHFWKLYAFLLLLLLVYFVALMAVSAVLGILILLVTGNQSPDSLPALVGMLIVGAVQAVMMMYFTALVARIYEQLAGRAASAAQVFE